MSGACSFGELPVAASRLYDVFPTHIHRQPSSTEQNMGSFPAALVFTKVASVCASFIGDVAHIVFASLVRFRDFPTAGSVIKVSLLSGSFGRLLKARVVPWYFVFALAVLCGAFWPYIFPPLSWMPLPWTTFLSVIWFVGDALPPLAQYFDSDRPTEENIANLTRHVVPTFLCVGTAIAVHKSSLLWSFFVGALCHRVTRISVIAGTAIATAWVLMPRGRSKKFAGNVIMSMVRALLGGFL